MEEEEERGEQERKSGNGSRFRTKRCPPQFWPGGGGGDERKRGRREEEMGVGGERKGKKGDLAGRRRAESRQKPFSPLLSSSPSLPNLNIFLILMILPLNDSGKPRPKRQGGREREE